MWDFTNLCGVPAAAASLANLRLKVPVKEISGVLLDNVIATVESFATNFNIRFWRPLVHSQAIF